MDKNKIKEIINDLWPKAKKELEVALDTSKVLLKKGESYLKDLSDKSVKEAKKLSLNLSREKLYYDLGKVIAGIRDKNKWLQNSRISELIKKIKSLGGEIKKIK